MKRVLWICNIMLPVIAKELGLPFSNREGWLSGIFEQLISEKEEKSIELGICFPMEKMPEQVADREKEMNAGQSVPCYVLQGVPCYMFIEDLSHPENYDVSLEESFAQIFADFKPDVIHIFGTEFPHALSAVRAFHCPERTLVGIQGLCGEIAKVYMAGLPEKVQKEVTFRDFIRKDSLRQQQKKFEIRGQHEKEVIQKCGNITGRTAFDREGTAKFNPKAKYFPMNETMRKEFYTGQWKQEACEPYSIFLSQGDYPLKGMHFMLEALSKLLPKYPKAKLYVAGNSIVENKTFKQKMKLSAYGKYLLTLIEKYDLKDSVVITGKLSAEEMKQQFLNSSVFVCPSVLENSPNTVGEAMLLGVPVVASKTGGIPDMITDGKEGLLIPVGDVDKLAECIGAMWKTETDETGMTMAQRLSQAARVRARKTHDGASNYQRLLEIYDSIG